MKRTNSIDKVHKFLFAFDLILLIFGFFFVIYLFQAGKISATDADVYTSIILSVIFPTSVFAYRSLKGATIRQIIGELGIAPSKFNKNTISLGVKIFILIFLIEIALSVISQFTNVNIPSTNVDKLLLGTPLFFLLFGILVTPFNEEIFFRGFLVPRYGIVAPALLFGMLHLGYGSITEFAGALLFGIIAGYYFKKTGSLYTTIIPHLLVNLVTIVSIVLGS